MVDYAGFGTTTSAGLEVLAEFGRLNPPMNRITFEEIPGAIDRLREGGVVARLVAIYE